MGRWREASHATVGKESAALPRRRRPCARGALESNRGGPREHYSRGHGPGEAHVLDPIARTIRGARCRRKHERDPSVLAQRLQPGHLRRRLHPAHRRQTRQPPAEAARLSHAARSVRAVVQARCTSELNPPSAADLRTRPSSRGTLDMKKTTLGAALVSLVCLLSAAAFAMPPAGQASAKVTPDMIQTGSDIPPDWKQPHGNFDYIKRDMMIPMRDGVRLHTVILIPKGAHDLPILLERTPYNTDSFVTGNSPHMADAVWSGDKDWADGSTILVWQDVRGKYGSEGNYV